MSIQSPFPSSSTDSTAASGAAGSPPVAAPTTLEALLSLRPVDAGTASPVRTGQGAAALAPAFAAPANAAATSPTDTASPGAGSADFDEDTLQLLFVHAAGHSSTATQAWIQHTLTGMQLHTIRFQDQPIEHIVQRMPNAVLIEFDTATTDMATHLVAQIRTAQPHLPLIAVGSTQYPQAMLAALRAGVHDFLEVDSAAPIALQTVQEAIQRRPAPQDTGPAAPLTAILSARSGLGSSLLAAHLSWYLQQLLQPPRNHKTQLNPPSELETLLVDLSHPNHGDSHLYLNTPGEFDFVQAVNNLRRVDRRLASSGFARHDSGLRVLSLPRQSALLRDISLTDTDTLLQRLRQYFGHIVTDLGTTTLTPLSTRVVRRASQIWVLCEQSVVSMVATTELLQKLAELEVDRQRVQLIVCRHDKQLELEPAQIAKQLNLPLLGVIPERRKELVQAVNRGQLLPPQQRREPYVQAVSQLAEHLVATYHQQSRHAADAATPGLLSPLLQRFRRS